jgi:hypothetical protein
MDLPGIDLVEPLEQYETRKDNCVVLRGDSLGGRRLSAV